MIIRQESGDRWLPVRIDDVEKWQEGLLEESARRLGAVLAPGGRVHRWGFVGSPVTFRGQRAWLRVSPFLEHEMSRKAWRGTSEAAAIEGVCKPPGREPHLRWGHWPAMVPPVPAMVGVLQRMRYRRPGPRRHPPSTVVCSVP